MQLSLTIPTSAPINVSRLSKQNKRLAEWLLSGNRINMTKSLELLQIGVLHSRIHECRKYLMEQHNIELKHERINVNGVSCNEYYIEPSELKLFN